MKPTLPSEISNKADIHTKLGAIREFSAMALGSFYLVNTMLSRTAPEKAALWTAIAFSLLTGLGSSYSHYELDRQHQASSESKARGSYQPLLPTIENGPLITYSQGFMLLVTAVGQANDFVGFPEDIIDLEVDGHVSNFYLIVINLVFLFFGLLGAWAEVRACKIAMEINNGTAQPTDENPNQKIDFWTLFSLAMKTIQMAITSLLFRAKLFDFTLPSKKLNLMDVSSTGLGCAILPALFTTCSSIFYQTFINLNNQGHNDTYTAPDSLSSDLETDIEISGISTEEVSADFLDNTPTSLALTLKTIGLLDDPNNTYATRFEKFLLVGRIMGSATEFSEEVTFLIAASLSRPWFICVLVLATSMGILISVSDARTAANNLENYRRNNKPNIDHTAKSCVEKFLFPFFFCKKHEKNDIETALLAPDSP